jgi:hypothetical protein
VKPALVAGITGHDGSYLAQFLISIAHEIHRMRTASHLRCGASSQPDPTYSPGFEFNMEGYRLASDFDVR